MVEYIIEYNSLVKPRFWKDPEGRGKTWRSRPGRLCGYESWKMGSMISLVVLRDLFNSSATDSVCPHSSHYAKQCHTILWLNYVILICLFLDFSFFQRVGLVPGACPSLYMSTLSTTHCDRPTGQPVSGGWSRWSLSPKCSRHCTQCTGSHRRTCIGHRSAGKGWKNNGTHGIYKHKHNRTLALESKD